MIRKTLVAVALALATGHASAQVADGDIVFTAWESTGARGLLLAFDPNTMTLSTVGNQTTAGHFLYQVAMAPGNIDMVASQTDAGFTSSQLIQYTTTGIATTIASGIPDLATGLALDGDNTWLTTSPLGVYTANHTTGAIATIAAAAGGDDFEGVTIIREGGRTYGVCNLNSSTALTGRVYDVDRTGIVGTIHGSASTLTDPYELMFAPTTGRIMTSNFLPGPGETEVGQLTLGGAISTFAVFFDPEGLRPLPDNTVYVAGNDTTPLTENTVRRYDMATGAVLATYQFPQVPLSNWVTYGVEIYGRRVVTCDGVGGPGGTINVTVQSHRLTAGGAPYQLALSTGRRPGITLQNGERLMLNVTDPLFFLTSTNQLPTIAQRFSGTLDATGFASASVKLPTNLPANLGITVFCGGVVLLGGNAIQVTNVHWFEL